MKPVSLKDHIAELHLSVRAFNCLMRGGVRTVEALLDIAQSPDLLKIRNLGVKCCEEVTTVAIQFLSGEGEFCLRERMAPVSQENPTIDHDITLQALGIAPRILNALLPDHITRASQLVMIPDQKLTSKYGLSDAACKDVLLFLKNTKAPTNETKHFAGSAHGHRFRQKGDCLLWLCTSHDPDR